MTTLVVTLLALLTSTLHAQEPITPPQPTPDAERGLQIFAERCASCHGPAGMGDGEMAAQLPQPPTALGSETYLRQADPARIFAVITNGIPQSGMPPFGPGNSDPISEADRWNLVAAIYSLGTPQSQVEEEQAIVDAMAAFEPIPAAEIAGTVTNETTGEPLSAGVPAVLNAFTTDFEPSLTMTTTLDAGGQFQFDLTMVPPDLVYVVTVEYEGISYGSDVGQLARDEPALNLEVSVFERSSDPSMVSIGQLHIILQFIDDQVQVSELYQFTQSASTVFVGQSGDPEQGSVHIALPPGARDPSFDRSFGGTESFFPADTVIQTEDGWADTVPLRPGEGTLSLLVRYTLPYEDSLSFSHPLRYDVGATNLVFPDAGVTLTSDGGWQEGEPQTMGEAGIFLNFTRANIAVDEAAGGGAITFSLQGEPQQINGTSAGITPQRDPTNALLIGGGALLLAIAVSGYALYVWRREQESEAEATPQAAEERRQALLIAIAALDDAHEAGELHEPDYEERRRALKEELVAIWES